LIHKFQGIFKLQYVNEHPVTNDSNTAFDWLIFNITQLCNDGKLKKKIKKIYIKFQKTSYKIEFVATNC
jgi:hypothetical protein